MTITALSFEGQDFATTQTQNRQRASLEHMPLGKAAAKNISGNADQSEAPEYISRQKLQNITDAVNSYVSSQDVELKFKIDERTKRVQVEVRDPATDKVIRKIPADQMLELAASIEQMAGLFLNKTL